jgi:hypothetical protein
MPRHAVENPRVLAHPAKAKPQNKASITLDEASGAPPLDDQASAAGTDPSATRPSSVDQRAGQSRKRTILGRYVFGDELKPGERWKRRLLTTR